jgi:putative PIN family toxin of toxin-antitoxin system
MRVVLDTDVVVAGLRSRLGASRAWLRAVRRGEVGLLLSVPLMLQYEAVLLRPENLAATRLDARQMRQVLDLFCAIGQPVEVSFLWRPMLRDPDDEMVLEAAMNGQADRLLTFNRKDFAGAEQLSLRIERPGPAWRAWQEGGT